MKKAVYEACGIDVHKKMLTICIVTTNLERVQTWECPNDGNNIRLLASTLKQHGVTMVAFESTGIYWQLLHGILESDFDVSLANPRQIKAIPGRKTDKNDATWIATLLVKGLIKKSYVPSPELRQLRDFCRTKASLKTELTRYLNKQHKLLDQWNVNFTQYFSKSTTLTCQYLLDGMVRNENWSELCQKAPTTRIANELLRKGYDLEIFFKRTFPELARVELAVLRELTKTHQQQIARLDAAINQLARELRLDDQIAIVESITGIGIPSAIALLAEIGGIDKFPSGRHLVSWCGLGPSVYQSAGKNYTGRITKQGNRHVRRILYNCINPCLKVKNTSLCRFYHRLRKNKLAGKARVALMAKMLRIMHALLSKSEMFEINYLSYKKQREIIPV